MTPSMKGLLIGIGTCLLFVLIVVALVGVMALAQGCP